MKPYKIIKKQPVFRFWYQGESHEHPVRRTVLAIRNTPTHLIGYEVRSGRNTVPYELAPVKTYRKDKIARYGDYNKLYNAKKNQGKDLESSTLERAKLREYFDIGA